MTRSLSFVVLSALASLASVVSAEEKCATFTVDFSDLERGEYVTTQFVQEYGLELDCLSEEGYGCRIFDTAVPWGNWEAGSSCDCNLDDSAPDACNDQQKYKDCGDPDLGSPHNTCDVAGPGEGKGGAKGKKYENCVPRGKVLVLDENGPDSPPDDSGKGGKMRLKFEFPTDLEEICFFDNDSAEQTKVSVFFSDGRDPVKKLGIPKLGDNGYGCIPLKYENVTKVNVLMDGSGSISDLKYQMCGKKKGGGGGDPHFKRWNRERATFHGECDLVMAHSDNFHNGAGFDMHVRSTIRHDLYSYFKSSAIRIGEHILEVTKEYVVFDGETYQHGDLPLVFGEHEYTYTIDNAPIEEHKDPKNRHYYKLDLNDRSSIKFEWYRHMLNIEIEGDERDFRDSIGMLGEYHTGDMLDRNGSLMQDFNEYGFEWQVDPSKDPMLFEEARSPQLPYEKCRMPSHTFAASRRKLRANKALVTAAELACASKDTGAEVDMCIQDVLMTGDVEMANTW